MINWRMALASLLLLLAAVVKPVQITAAKPPRLDCTCETPINAVINVQNYNGVSITWNHNEEDVSFKVWYYRREDNYTSAETITGNKSILYSNLQAGTYTFHLVAICGEEQSASIVFDDLILL